MSPFKMVPLLFTSLMLLLLVERLDTTTIEDYCLFSSANTPCLTRCRRAPRCGNTSDAFAILTPAERKIIVNRHNFHRNNIAKGLYADHYLPGVRGGMNALSYDLELEFMANCWIQQCTFAHDKTRLNLNGEKLGQNLHQRYYNVEVPWSNDFLTNGVDSWFNEYKLLTSNDSNMVSSFYPKKGTGHLTTMIWGDTKFVGCAKMHFMQARKGHPEILDHSYNLYCTYGPKGNWLNARIYGDKLCDRMNEGYEYLCGEVRDVSEDGYRAPLDFTTYDGDHKETEEMDEFQVLGAVQTVDHTLAATSSDHGTRESLLNGGMVLLTILGNLFNYFGN